MALRKGNDLLVMLQCQSCYNIKVSKQYVVHLKLTWCFMSTVFQFFKIRSEKKKNTKRKEESEIIWIDPLKASFVQLVTGEKSEGFEAWRALTPRRFSFAEMEGFRWQGPQIGLRKLRVIPGQKLENNRNPSPITTKKWILPITGELARDQEPQGELQPQPTNWLQLITWTENPATMHLNFWPTETVR